MAISRLYPHAAGDLIEASEWNEEVNAIITELNSKPDADGTPQTNTNADMVDGYHAVAAGTAGSLAINNGTLMETLDADTLDGLHASDLQEGGFPSKTRMVFAGLGDGTPGVPTGGTSVPAGWTDVTPTSGADPYVLSTHKTDARYTTWDSPAIGEVAAVGGAWSNLQVEGTLSIPHEDFPIPAHSHTVNLTRLTRNNGSGTAWTAYVENLTIGSGFTTGSTGETSGTFTQDIDSDLGTWRPPTLRVEIGQKD
jgi:hypothetical protein